MTGSNGHARPVPTVFAKAIAKKFAHMQTLAQQAALAYTVFDNMMRLKELEDDVEWKHAAIMFALAYRKNRQWVEKEMHEHDDAST